MSRLISAQATERLKGEQATWQYVGNAYVGNARHMPQDGLGQTTDLLALHSDLLAKHYSSPLGSQTY